MIKLKEETDEIEVKNLKILQNYTDQALFALLKTLSASYMIQGRDPMVLYRFYNKFINYHYF